MIDKMMLEGGIIDMQKKIDLINGPILSSLTKLALPIMATSLIQMAYNMIDMSGSDAWEVPPSLLSALPACICGFLTDLLL